MEGPSKQEKDLKAELEYIHYWVSLHAQFVVRTVTSTTIEFASHEYFGYRQYQRVQVTDYIYIDRWMFRLHMFLEVCFNVQYHTQGVTCVVQSCFHWLKVKGQGSYWRDQSLKHDH